MINVMVMTSIIKSCLYRVMIFVIMVVVIVIMMMMMTMMMVLVIWLRCLPS
jgi:hypothetical protein